MDGQTNGQTLRKLMQHLTALCSQTKTDAEVQHFYRAACNADAVL